MRSTFLQYGLALAAASWLAACGPYQSADNPNTGDPSGVSETAAGDEGSTGDDSSAATPSGGATGDAPEISRSVGVEGGVVVFWPRVIPRTDDPALRGIAGQLQKVMADMAKKALPDAAQDVRPEPERVCPKVGCKAMTVGVLFTPSGGGCAAMALISAPGEAPTRIIPWVGQVELKQETVPFRDPPENAVTIKDMVKCEDVLGKVAEKEADVIKAIQDVASGS